MTNIFIYPPYHEASSCLFNKALATKDLKYGCVFATSHIRHNPGFQ